MEWVGPWVEGLPIVLASRLIGYPGLEIGLGGVRVVVLVVGAVIPVVPRVRVAVRSLPLVVDMDVVPFLAVGPLLLVFLVVLVAPRILRGLRLAVIVGASRFAVLEVTIGVVVLGVLVPVCSSTLVGQDRRSREHHRRQQGQKQHQPSQLILLPKASPYSISRRLEPKPPFHEGGTLGEAPPCSLHNRGILAISDELCKEFLSNFRKWGLGELRRIPLPRTPVNKDRERI